MIKKILIVGGALFVTQVVVGIVYGVTSEIAKTLSEKKGE